MSLLPRAVPGFCGGCGTSLIWRSEGDKRTFDLFLGTVDEKWLVQGEGRMEIICGGSANNSKRDTILAAECDPRRHRSLLEGGRGSI